MGEGAGKDHEGHKRQDDKWGGLGTMKTRFISFPAKGRSSVHAGVMEEKQDVLVSAGPDPLPHYPCQLPAGPSVVPTSPQT